MYLRRWIYGFALCCLPCAVSATEWIDCNAGQYWFSFLVSPSVSDIIEYQIILNDVNIDLSNYKLEQRTLDYTQGVLEVVIKAQSSEPVTYKLTAKGDAGLLQMGDRKIEMGCVWGVGGD